jgi:hypothetical protein
LPYDLIAFQKYKKPEKRYKKPEKRYKTLTQDRQRKSPEKCKAFF